jgi:hypothetical protein
LGKKLGLWLVFGLILVFLWSYFSKPGREEMGYSKFLQEVKQGRIHAVRIQGEEITGEYPGAAGKAHRFKTYAPGDNNLIGLLHENAVDIQVKPQKDSAIAQFLLSWAPALLLIGLWVFFLRQMQKSRAQKISAQQTQEESGIEEQRRHQACPLCGAQRLEQGPCPTCSSTLQEVQRSIERLDSTSQVCPSCGEPVSQGGACSTCSLAVQEVKDALQEVKKLKESLERVRQQHPQQSNEPAQCPWCQAETLQPRVPCAACSSILGEIILERKRKWEATTVANITSTSKRRAPARAYDRSGRPDGGSSVQNFAVML